jgi:hypothetical protein
MENVLHPTCSCGQPVAHDFEMIPIFEDGIQIAAQQGDVYFLPYCEPCMYEAYLEAETNHYPMFGDERDELPF